MSRSPTDSRGPRRRRLPAAQARARILAAARQRLRQDGPQALRLADVARDLGITHQAILHHFESRDGLLQELVSEAFGELGRGLVEAFESRRADDRLEPRELLDRVFATFDDGGHGRLMAWLNLAGLFDSDDAAPPMLMRGIAEALHASRREAGADSDFEQTLFIVLLVGIFAFGDSVAGESMRRSAGIADDPEASERFRGWLAELIVRQFG